MKKSNIQICIQLMHVVKPLMGYIVLAVILGLFGHLAATFITILGIYGVLGIVGYEFTFSLSTLFILLGIIALLRGVFHYGEQACNHYVAFSVLALLRGQLFKALRKLCPAKLEQKGKGDLISLMTSDIELLEVFYAHTISPVLIALMMSVIMICYIASFHLYLGLVAFCAYLCVGVIVPIYISKSSKQHGMIFREKAGQLSSYVLESLRGIKEIMQYHQGASRLQGIQIQSESLSNEEMKMKVMQGRNAALTNSIVLSFAIFILCIALYLYQNEGISFAGVILSFVAMVSSFGPLIALANLGSTLQNTFASARRVLAIVEEVPLVEDIEGKQKTSFGDIQLNDVHFAYDKEDVISNVSLLIPQHQIVSIHGQSGSGKSTLLKLLMRFWKVEQDTIHISKKSIENINTSDLRNMESFMSQETHLFQGSILENINMVNKEVTIEQVSEACKKAAIHDFIMGLPNQYDTKVSELGESLSGGEKQRIGLARAFLHNAPLLLLDEPTSNIDSLNEAKILQAINQQRKEKTVILVSHRKSTMRLADVVYHMKQGRVS